MAPKLRSLKGHIDSISKGLGAYLKQPSIHSVFVLYGLPLVGKTSIAKELAERLGGMYLDLLSDSLTTLDPCLGLYEPRNFKRDINEYSKTASSILVVDEIEAILDTWTREQQESLFKMLYHWRAHSLILLVTRIDLDFERFLGDDKVFRIRED